jgi:hypothetical protein
MGRVMEPNGSSADRFLWGAHDVAMSALRKSAALGLGLDKLLALEHSASRSMEDGR